MDTEQIMIRLRWSSAQPHPHSIPDRCLFAKRQNKACFLVALWAILEVLKSQYVLLLNQKRGALCEKAKYQVSEMVATYQNFMSSVASTSPLATPEPFCLHLMSSAVLWWML
jgi:hypothetical protein